MKQNQNTPENKIFFCKKTSVLVFTILMNQFIFANEIVTSTEINSNTIKNVNRLNLDLGIQVRPEMKTSGDKENITYRQLSLGYTSAFYTSLAKISFDFIQNNQSKTDGNQTLNYSTNQTDVMLGVGYSVFQSSLFSNSDLLFFVNGYFGQTKSEVNTKLYSSSQNFESQPNSIFGIGFESNLLINNYFGIGAEMRGNYSTSFNPETQLTFGIKMSGYLSL